MSYYIGLSILSNTMKRQKTLSSAESRRILSKFENREIAENDFSKEAGGRPFFPDRDVDFNISHSGDAVAVSYIDKKDYRVGCDIERIRTRKRIEKIAEDKFSASENNYLFSDGTFNEVNFFRIWTLKECYIKLRGLSIFDMSKVPSFINEIPQTQNYDFSFCADVSKPLTFRLYELSSEEKIHFILAEAIEGEYLQPEILWLSSLTLDCRITAEIKAAPNPAHTVSPNK